MPGLSGLDLQDRLIDRGQRIPVIFVTGRPEEYARRRSKKAGAICFLCKPYDHDELINCLDKALKAA